MRVKRFLPSLQCSTGARNGAKAITDARRTAARPSEIVRLAKSKRRNRVVHQISGKEAAGCGESREQKSASLC